MGAGVVPQDAGPEDVVGPVQQGRPVHVAAEADPSDHAEGAARGQRIEAGRDRGDPVGRTLFRPAGMRALHLERGVRLVDGPLGVVDE